MATPEPHAPSRRLRSAAEAERERLSKELGRLDERASVLHHELEKLDSKRAELRDQLALLARLTADAEDSPFPSARKADKAGHLRPVQADTTPPKAVLAGARIRETAVLLLASSPTPRRPIHYQQWFELLRSAGYGIDAQDPVAAFLTQINRSPVVRRAGAPGVYALDFEATSRLRRQLRQLEHELARAISAGDEEAATATQWTGVTRKELIRRIRMTERLLAEALRSLGESGD